MAWNNPFTWFAPKAVKGFEAAAAEAAAIPAAIGEGYRSMAWVLQEIAEARDRCALALKSGDPGEQLAAKNYVFYGDGRRQALFGAPDGEPGLDRPALIEDLCAAGFSAEQAEDLAPLCDYFRTVALEWDRQSRTGELKAPAAER